MNGKVSISGAMPADLPGQNMPLAPGSDSAAVQDIMSHRRAIPQAFTVKIFNDSGGDATYSMFDYFGGCNSGADGDAGDITTAFAGGITGVQKLTASSPVFIKALKYKASAATQLSNTVTFYKCDLNGDVKTLPLDAIIQQAESPQNYNDKILDLKWNFLLDGYSDITVYVANTVTVTLTFYVAEIWRPV